TCSGCRTGSCAVLSSKCPLVQSARNLCVFIVLQTYPRALDRSHPSRVATANRKPEMFQTPNLKLPYIAPAQAQKHVTHNEAIRALDALVHIAVEDRDLPEPPADPADGARYIVAEG